MPFDAGGMLDGKYDILKRLATGGMGDVYLVRHHHLQERRVVKVLRADLAADGDAMQRFQQEARVATQIKHPNVAILYDYSRLPDGRYYMVWEYIEGEDLASRIRKGPVPAADAIELMIQALRGLDAIHSAGVIHRDVSPDNLMLTRDLRGKPLVKIIDLGLAKDLNPGAEAELTQAGSFLGKFQYCSPEQAGYLKDAPLDPRSDLYSLAQVLYEMVSGLPPYDSESQHGFVLKRLTEEPMPLRARNPRVQVPASLEPVILKGLARDREQRYPDAVSFLHALVRVAQGLREVATQELSAAEVRQAVEKASGGATAEARTVISRGPAAAAAAAADARPGSTSSGAGPGATAGPAPGTIAGSAAGKAVAPVAKTPRPAGASLELTREEKEALLARIDRAASRVQEGGQFVNQAEAALREGRFEEARNLVRKLDATTPNAKGLGDLKRRLQEAEDIARRRQQVLQAEGMLEKYLLDRQQTLAGLALETLLDLYPNHPKKGDYESWVGHLAQDAEQQKRAERLYADAQGAVARGELHVARRRLEEVERLDLSGKLAGALLAEINETERSSERGRHAQSVRTRLEDALRRGAVEEADQQLEALAALEVTKVTLDTLRGQVEDAKLRREHEEAAGSFEAAFAEATARADWYTARETARQMLDALPGHPRPRQMMTELSRLQENDQRQRALEEGLRAFEGYLQSGALSQAELALKVLRGMGGDDPRIAEAERRFLRERG